MKKSIYLSLIFGAFLFVSCKEMPKIQKVVLVQGSFKYDKAKSSFMTTFEGKELIIPNDSLLSGTVLSRDTVTGTYQVSMLLKDNGSIFSNCGDNGENCKRFARPINIASINPPPCWQGGGQCNGLLLTHLVLDPNPESLLPAYRSIEGDLQTLIKPQ